MMGKDSRMAERSVPEGYHLVPPNGGYAWVMVAASVAIGILYSIPVISIGLLLPDIIQQTHSSAATASWIPAMAFSLGLIVAPFNILFMEKYSYRASAYVGGILMSLGLCLSYFGSSVVILFITYGVLFGIGFGITSNSTTLILNQYFTTRYGQAIGYVMAGHALSRLVFSPIVELLLELYDYQGVFLLLGGVVMNCVAISQLFHPATPHLKLKLIETKAVDGNEILIKPEKVSEPEKASNGNHNVPKDDEAAVAMLDKTSDNQHDDDDHQNHMQENSSSCWDWCATGPFKILNFSQLKQPIFYLLFFSNFTMFILSVYTGVFMPSLMLENGLTSMQAAVVQSARSGGEVAGRMFLPWAQAQFKINLRGFYIVICALQATTLIIMVFLTNFAAASTCSAMIGFVSGGFIGLSIMMLVDCVGIKNMGATYSLIMFLNGFISIGFGPTIGFLRDILGSFSICFYVLATWLTINCFLWSLKPWIIPRK